MECGVVLSNSGPMAKADVLIPAAEHAEALGFETLWTSDHLVLPVESETHYPYVPAGTNVRLDPRHAFLDPMIVLAGLATRTRRIGLGVSVYLAALRHPLVVAKLVASLDQLSGGRVRLGVGAGWIPEEYATLGIPFAERGRWLDDHLACLRALWSQPFPSHAGEHYQVENVGFEPKPMQSPLPILVGGNSAPARRRAARLGNGWHVIDVPAAELRTGIEDLRRRCEAQGRDPDAVAVSIRSQIAFSDRALSASERFAPLIGSPDQVFEELDALQRIGVSHVALWPAGRNLDLDTLRTRMEELASEVLPRFGQRVDSDAGPSAGPADGAP